MSLYIDLTEFLKNPITTGIQRIAGELCKHMPPNTAIPVRLHDNQYHALPASLIELIGQYFSNPTEFQVARLRRLAVTEKNKVISISVRDTVLVPEVIIEPRRLRYLEALSDAALERHRFIIYDLLPITHPELFRTDWLLEICAYYRVLRRAQHCAFISEATRDDFYGRLKRTKGRGGVVLPLGSDGLGAARATYVNKVQPLNFSVLGTIEPRKNHKLILEAFEPLLGSLPGLTLSFIGKMGWVDGDFAHKIRTMAADESSGFKFYPGHGDDTVRSKIEDSRATIYLSSAEGYGLPPMESLWLGTPVIASRTIPSLKSVGKEGVHYVEPLDVLTLRRAVLGFLDDSYAREKAREAASVRLPTWKSFTYSVLEWCGAKALEDQLTAAAY